MSSWRCVRCAREGGVRLTSPREVTVGGVAAVIERAPVVDCPGGHADPPPIGAAVAEACLAALPTARSRRLRPNDACGHCGTPLTMPVRRTERPVTIVDVPGVPVLTIHFDLPATRCPACGTDQVLTRAIGELRAVVHRLFKA